MHAHTPSLPPSKPRSACLDPCDVRVSFLCWYLGGLDECIKLTEMRGFLQKKSQHIGWTVHVDSLQIIDTVLSASSCLYVCICGGQTRFFVLRERKLTYYRHQYDRKPRGTLDFDLIQVQIEVGN